MPMRDVDQALERLARGSAEIVEPGQPGVLPPPHFGWGESAAVSRGGASATVEPVWSETLEALDRQHGARFEVLADQLLAARESRHFRVLLFTSCHRAEGRTTLVLALARRFAQRPMRTLLIDADLSGPMIGRSMGLRVRAGLDDVIDRGVAFNEALIPTSGGRLTILPLRAAVERPREFLASPGWSLALARARRDFDLVLIDGSPLFTGLSATALHRSVDAAVLVFHRGVTGDRAMSRAQEVLESGGVPLLGLAETFV